MKCDKVCLVRTNSEDGKSTEHEGEEDGLLERKRWFGVEASGLLVEGPPWKGPSRRTYRLYVMLN